MCKQLITYVKIGRKSLDSVNGAEWKNEVIKKQNNAQELSGSSLALIFGQVCHN